MINDNIQQIVDGILAATGNTATVTAVDQAASYVLGKDGKQTAVLWDGLQLTLSAPLQCPARLRQAIEARLPLDVRIDGRRLFLYRRYTPPPVVHDLRAGQFVAPSPPANYVHRSEV